MPIDLGIIDEVLLPIFLIATLAVFIGDFIANTISFENRVMNAVILAVIVGIAVLGFGLFINGSTIGQIGMPAMICAALALVVGYLGNVIAFDNRFVNALVTAIVFAVVCAIGLYASTLIS